MNEEQLISTQEFTSDRLTVKQKVYRLVQRFPYLKDDYNMLIFFFWHYYDDSNKIIESDGTIPIQKFHRLTPAESITRAFRELVEHGRIKLDWNTKNQREIKQVQFHHYYATIKSESL